MVEMVGLMDRVLYPVTAKLRLQFPVKPEFFRFFFNHQGCSFNCKEHVRFQIFIHSSKYESFHTVMYTSIHVISTIRYIRNSQWPALQLVWLALILDRALHLVIAKVRVRYPLKPGFFQVLFQPLRLFIQLQGSCLLWSSLSTWKFFYIR